MQFQCVTKRDENVPRRPRKTPPRRGGDALQEERRHGAARVDNPAGSVTLSMKSSFFIPRVTSGKLNSSAPAVPESRVFMSPVPGRGVWRTDSLDAAAQRYVYVGLGFAWKLAITNA